MNIQVPDFCETFPTFYSRIDSLVNCCDYKEIYHEQNFKLMYKCQVEFMREFEQEFIKFKKERNYLKKQYFGCFCGHSISVFYFVKNHKDLKSLPLQIQNVLLWAALFHDISKRNYPTFPNIRKDFIHPFTSAATTLNILLRYVNSNSEIIEKTKILSEFINKSYYIVYDNVLDENIEFPINNNIPEILKQLEEIFLKDSDIYLVVKLILLHQALPMIDIFPPTMSLSNDEIRNYFDFNLVKIMKILMESDSLAYNIGDENFSNKLLAHFQMGYKNVIEILNHANNT